MQLRKMKRDKITTKINETKQKISGNRLEIVTLLKPVQIKVVRYQWIQ
jgi:hypothetical protein